MKDKKIIINYSTDKIIVTGSVDVDEEDLKGKLDYFLYVPPDCLIIYPDGKYACGINLIKKKRPRKFESVIEAYIECKKCIELSGIDRALKDRANIKDRDNLPLKIVRVANYSQSIIKIDEENIELRKTIELKDEKISSQNRDLIKLISVKDKELETLTNQFEREYKEFYEGTIEQELRNKVYFLNAKLKGLDIDCPIIGERIILTRCKEMGKVGKCRKECMNLIDWRKRK